MVSRVAAGEKVAGRRRLVIDLHSPWMSWLIPLAVGLACFAITELMHRLLVPDLGGRKERWLAEAVSALVVVVLVAKLADVARQYHETMLARVQVISEMNHHIRNALMAISASADMSQDEQRMRLISESVYRIDWALREILPRKQPLPDMERTRLMYVMSSAPKRRTEADRADLHFSTGTRK
jgi:hypothetical protein